MAVRQAVADAFGVRAPGGAGTTFMDDARAWPGRGRTRGSALPRALHLRRDGRLWVVILAGGEGRRLLDFTRGADGVAVPKQFYRFRDERTLLRVTLDRAARLVPLEQVVVVMLEDHRAWWEPELAALPPENVLAQPAGKGTAVAILHALEHIRTRDWAARIVLMPSDHDVEAEDVMVTTLGSAARASACYPDDLLLLGTVPTDADEEYGMVVPRAGDRTPIPRVRSFVEKPPAALGADLIRRGARWNTFIFTGSARMLLGLYARTLPALLEVYRRGFAQARDGGYALRKLFTRLPEHDFSRDLLQRAPAHLRLATVPECGWTDLGTPARLAAWLDRHRDARYLAERRAPPRGDPLARYGFGGPV